MSTLLHSFVAYVVSVVSGMGYLGIFILMVLESSFIPFPSEVVLIPAGYLAFKGEMNIWMVVAAGITGSLLGAVINYFLAVSLGRKFIIRYGRYFLLSEDKFLLLERAFLKHGSFATFIGRLIFGIRQWISIPAGLSKMPFATFSIYTTLGASIWVVILVSLGYFLGEGQESRAYAKLIGYWLLGAVVIMSLAYYYWQSPAKSKHEKE